MTQTVKKMLLRYTFEMKSSSYGLVVPSILASWIGNKFYFFIDDFFVDLKCAEGIVADG